MLKPFVPKDTRRVHPHLGRDPLGELGVGSEELLLCIVVPIWKEEPPAQRDRDFGQVMMQPRELRVGLRRALNAVIENKGGGSLGVRGVGQGGPRVLLARAWFGV